MSVEVGSYWRLRGRIATVTGTSNGRVYYRFMGEDDERNMPGEIFASNTEVVNDVATPSMFDEEPA